VIESQQAEYERLGHKRLKLVDVIAQSVGFIGPVFSAAFLIPLIAGAGASGRGAGLATPFAVLLSAVGVFALGWIVAQYAKRIHAAGSLYDYVSMGLGRQVGGVAGWVYYGGTTVLAAAIVCLIGGLFRDILAAEFNVDPLPGWAWSLIYVAITFLIMYMGVRISTRAQLTLALSSAVVVLLFFAYVIAKAPEQKLSAFSPTSSADGWAGILYGVVYGVLIFVGFETAANLAEETAHPKRSIPRAVLYSVVIVAAFYLIAAYSQLAGFHFDVKTFTSPDVSAAGAIFILASPKSASPFSYGGTWILRLIELVVLLDIAAVGLGAAVASTRGVFALARDRRLPRALATVSHRRGTPVGAIVFVEAFALLMLGLSYWSRTLFQQPGFPPDLHYFSMFIWLSTFGGFVLLMVYAALAVGAFRGLADHPGRAVVWIAALVGLAISLGGIYGAVYEVPSPTNLVLWFAIGWLVVGIIVTLAVRGRAPARGVLSDLRSEETVSGG
jgi:amino acid transporter